MKTTIIKSALAALVIGLFLTVTPNIFAQTDTLPTLRGGEAVEQLKQSGGYDSLMAAVNAARQNNNQPEEPDAPEAVGQSAQLLAAGGGADDRFGYSVAISGETAIVGAYFDDVALNSNQGSAYIFERTGTVWTQQQQLIDSSGAANDRFGRSVAISGDKVLVGASLSDASTPTPFDSGQGESNAPSAINQGAAIFFVNAPFAPTAANVSIAGRVITPQDLGLTNAFVTLTDSRGVSRTIITGKRGNFRFDNVLAGETYLISVTSRRYTYAPQVVTVTEDLTNLTFTAQ